jgi:hypothetical protein
MEIWILHRTARRHSHHNYIHKTVIQQGLNCLYVFLCFSCFVDRASLYNLVNKANLGQNLFLVYLSISTCCGRTCAYHHEKQLCLCDIWYLLFCMDDRLVCRVATLYIRHSHRITSTKCRINTVVSPDDGHIFARNM